MIAPTVHGIFKTAHDGKAHGRGSGWQPVDRMPRFIGDRFQRVTDPMCLRTLGCVGMI